MGSGPNLGLRANNIAKTVFWQSVHAQELPCVLRCAPDISGEELVADWEVPEEAAQFPETGGFFRIDWQLVPGRLIGSVLQEETEALSTARAAPAGFYVAANLSIIIDPHSSFAADGAGRVFAFAV